MEIFIGMRESLYSNERRVIIMPLNPITKIKYINEER
jgi:hypothetical protein